MTILNVSFNNVGQAGQLPQFIYIDTNNTVTQVTAVGFLNKLVSEGLPINESLLAVVSTRATPSAKQVSVDIFNITYSGGNWSLTASTDLMALPDAQIYVGNSGGVATPVTMSGDVTLDNAGVSAISAGVIVDADVNAAAAIAYSKLAALTSGNVLVGSAGNVATSVAMSGDATIIASGALTIANNAVTTAKILDANVTLAKLASGITPSHIVKFAGKQANGGGSATIAITVTGALATDIAMAEIQASTNAVSIQKVTPSTDTVTVLLSGDPGASTTVAYQVLRAAA